MLPSPRVFDSSLSRKRVLALAMLHVLGAQHEVREVDVPGMRRNVRTLRHEAHVTQVTVIDDVPVDLLVDAIELERRARVDRVEQCREGIAQAEAAATAMADVEDALEFFLERGFVDELGASPVERMTRGSLQAALAYSGFSRAHGAWPSDGVEGFLEAIRVRAFGLRERLEPVGDFGESFFARLPSPCPGTCRCTRASRRRWPPSDSSSSRRSADPWPDRPPSRDIRGDRARGPSRLRRWNGTRSTRRCSPRRRPWLRNTGNDDSPATRPRMRPSDSSRSCCL